EFTADNPLPLKDRVLAVDVHRGIECVGAVDDGQTSLVATRLSFPLQENRPIEAGRNFRCLRGMVKPGAARRQVFNDPVPMGKSAGAEVLFGRVYERDSIVRQPGILCGVIFKGTDSRDGGDIRRTLVGVTAG